MPADEASPTQLASTSPTELTETVLNGYQRSEFVKVVLINSALLTRSLIMIRGAHIDSSCVRKTNVSTIHHWLKQ